MCRVATSEEQLESSLCRACIGSTRGQKVRYCSVVKFSKTQLCTVIIGPIRECNLLHEQEEKDLKLIIVLKPAGDGILSVFMEVNDFFVYFTGFSSVVTPLPFPSSPPPPSPLYTLHYHRMVWE